MAFVNNQLQAPATLEQLRAQLQQLQQQGPGGDRAVGSRSSITGSVPMVQSGVGRFNTDQMNLMNQIQRMQGGGGGSSGSGNGVDDLLRQGLMERAGAGAGPYDAATRAALMTQASDTAGQVALNSRGRIHGSAGDPSVMAANNEADARRLATIQGAQLGINTQANVANYSARGQALGQLAGYQNNQQDFGLRQAMANNQANQTAYANNVNAQRWQHQLGQDQREDQRWQQMNQPQQPQRQPQQPQQQQPQQGGAYMSGQPQQPVGRTPTQVVGPVNTGTIYGPPLRSPVNEPVTAANLLPHQKR
jgi:hypothetical protein